MTGRDRFDVIEAFAGPLPVIVIAEMLGVDPAARHDFKCWSDWQAMSLNPLLTEDQHAAVKEAGEELREYLRRVLAERRADPRDDLISAMLAVEEAGDQLTDGEIVTMCELLNRYNAIELATDRLGWINSVVFRGMKGHAVRVAR